MIGSRTATNAKAVQLTRLLLFTSRAVAHRLRPPVTELPYNTEARHVVEALFKLRPYPARQLAASRLFSAHSVRYGRRALLLKTPTAIPARNRPLCPQPR